MPATASTPEKNRVINPIKPRYPKLKINSGFLSFLGRLILLIVIPSNIERAESAMINPNPSNQINRASSQVVKGREGIANVLFQAL